MSIAALRVCVFGSGSFGTAMGTLAARNGHRVTLLGRNDAVANHINTFHRNPKYLSEHQLPDNLTATTDAADALANVDFIIHCVPVQASAAFLRSMAGRGLIHPDTPIISTSKGIDTHSLQLMHQIVPEALHPEQPTAFVSGPSFAKELVAGYPTGLMIASDNLELAGRARSLLSNENLRCYLTQDVVGVEVAGALKNVFAIAAGCVDGLGLGMNTTALLVTRGCKEIERLATAMGAEPHTLSGLAGIGDLMLTCFGKLSRNRNVGFRLGQGETMDEILASVSEVAEGVATTAAAVRLAKDPLPGQNVAAVDVPMMQAMADVLVGKITPKEASQRMMSLVIHDE